MNAILRPAIEEDLGSILEIYNHYVLNSDATFDFEPRTPKAGEQWFRTRTDRHPIVVADDSGRVLGWSSLSPWSSHGGYRNTCELSIYVHPTSTGRGIGRSLFRAVVASAIDLGHHCLLARITTENPLSASMHQRAGFEVIGVMKEAGEKRGRYLDVLLLQKLL